MRESTRANVQRMRAALAALEAAEARLYGDDVPLVASPSVARPRRRLIPLPMPQNVLTAGAAAIAVLLVGILIVSFALPREPDRGGQGTPPPLRCPRGMLPIPRGPFLMGAEARDSLAKPDENPARQITLDSFCIDRAEVSNAEYVEFLKAAGYPAPQGWNGSDFPTSRSDNFGELPVVDVNWFDAQAFCSWRGTQAGVTGYGLPTEAQWEKAARGTDGLIYPWGNDPPEDRPNLQLANYGNEVGELRPVTSYPSGRSPFGVLNMAGNAAEWTADFYEADVYQRMPDVNPSVKEQAGGRLKVVRGGSYVDGVELIRTTARQSGFQHDQPYSYVGFRCASPPQ